ncbi:Rid family hydrolase [Algimonas arctica]|nr:Rid family hydrolase [Algimonas arctica]
MTMLSACATTINAERSPESLLDTIVPASLAETYETLQYAPATRAGDMLYLSGVLAIMAEGETSIEPAIERSFDEIEMILAESGADWSDVVDVTSYTTDLDAHLGPLWGIKSERVGAPYPSWTLIGVDRLYGGDGAIIETKMTAYLPEP